MTDPFLREYGKLNWMTWKYTAGNLSSFKKCMPPGGGKRGGNQGIGPGKGNPGRLFNTQSADEKVREKIESLFPNEEFTIECYFTEKGEDPEKVETKLLWAYLQAYYELPPANHKSVRF